jgi:uncharacterized Zn-binding protein involved in type VI secretion
LPDLQALFQRFQEFPTIPELWISSDLRSDGYCFGARIPETRTRKEPMNERQKPTKTVKSTENQEPAGVTRRDFIQTALTVGTAMVVGVGASASAQAQSTRTTGLKGIRRPPPKLVAEPVLKIESYFGPTTAYLTRGWIFKVSGAPQGAAVAWSGTGSFQYAMPNAVIATFQAPGQNTVSVSCTVGGKTYSASLKLVAKDANNYARLGGKAQCPSDAHGCPACPHTVMGPIIEGHKLYKLDGLPIARVGDHGVHASCCGPNSFVISAGDSEVLIDGKPAARIGDATQHCGGKGKIISR